MSKAFTSEETPESVPVVRPPPRLRPGEVRYVTPEGQAALTAARAHLAAARAEALRLAEPERAARLAELDARLAAADGTLAALTVLGPTGPEDQVGFGSWVTVENEAGQRTTWRIVGPDEADARRGSISAEAPVARALLGREAGDEVEVQRPGGSRTLRVVEVRRTVPA
ncbi:MAG: GreA/GreB family elongation factor [Anaeromyxobacter sp.]